VRWIAPRPSGVPPSKYSVECCLIASAKFLKFAIERGMSTWLAWLRGLPVS